MSINFTINQTARISLLVSEYWEMYAGVRDLCGPPEGELWDHKDFREFLVTRVPHEMSVAAGAGAKCIDFPTVVRAAGPAAEEKGYVYVYHTAHAFCDWIVLREYMAKAKSDRRIPVIKACRDALLTTLRQCDELFE